MIAEVLFEITIPVFVVIAVGVAFGRAFKPDLTALNRVALYAAVPALVFSSLSTSEIAVREAGVLLAAHGLYLCGMAAIAFFAAVRLPPASRRGLVATSLFGNAANIMLPVSYFAFGEPGLQRAIVLYVFATVMLFTLGPAILGSSSGFGRARFVRAILRLPVLWAALAALLVSALGISVPVGLERGLALLGQAAIPVVLLLLGFQIVRNGLRLPSVVNVLGTSLKLVVGPIVGFVTAWLVGARGLDLAILSLLAGMPPAVNVAMLALEFGADAEEVASTTILATIASIGSIALVLVAVGRFVGS